MYYLIIFHQHIIKTCSIFFFNILYLIEKYIYSCLFFQCFDYYRVSFYILLIRHLNLYVYRCFSLFSWGCLSSLDIFWIKKWVSRITFLGCGSGHVLAINIKIIFSTFIISFWCFIILYSQIYHFSSHLWFLPFFFKIQNCLLKLKLRKCHPCIFSSFFYDWFF